MSFAPAPRCAFACGLFLSIFWQANFSIRAQDAASSDSPTSAAIVERYEENAKPVLEDYCYKCHGYGASKGDRAFDKLEAEGKLLNDPILWSKMLSNVRAGVMPPAGEEKPTEKEVRLLAAWVEQDVFGIDPLHPDPGRVVLRRLNRVEYQNTVHDLLGYDYDVELNFPPDDTGYGFDTIGEALNVSAMLTEKYLNAAETIVDEAVPKVTRKPIESVLHGEDFVDALSAAQDAPAPEAGARRGGGGGGGRGRLPLTGRDVHFDEAARLEAKFDAPLDGQYEFDLTIYVDGAFEYNPERTSVQFVVDDQTLLDQIYVYHSGEAHHYTLSNPQEWKAGEHQLRFDLTPLEPVPGARPGDRIRRSASR